MIVAHTPARLDQISSSPQKTQKILDPILNPIAITMRKQKQKKKLCSLSRSNRRPPDLQSGLKIRVSFANLVGHCIGYVRSPNY